jgi:hypothetical protein
MTQTTIGREGFTLLSFHDVHLGHHRTPTEEIIAGVKKAILAENPKLVSCIAFQGDLFDRDLQLSAHCVTDIHEFFEWLLRYCKEHDIWLRVLEGTPSHDWKQSRLLVTLNRLLRIDCELYYAEQLEIETLPNGMTVLYVPDEWSIDPADTHRQAVRLLESHGLAQVDFIFMHGAFEYQLPPHVPHATHSSSEWQPLARQYILCGHIHQHSHRGNILVAGSHNRLAHNEEAPKGHLRVWVRGSRKGWAFVENAEAKVYRTIDCIGLSLEAAYDEIREIAQSTPARSYLRVKASSTDSILRGVAALRQEFPQFYWDTKGVREEELTESRVDPTDVPVFRGTSLTATNLPHLVKERMTRTGVTAELQLRVVQLLEDLQCEVS